MLVMIGVLISLISLNQLTGGQPSELKCIKSKAQPTHPVQMETAIFKAPQAPAGNDTKTTHVNEQTYNCIRPGHPPIYKDLTTYTNIWGHLERSEFIPNATSMLTVNCERNSTGDLLTCGFQDWNNVYPAMKSCEEETPIPPIQVNTITYGTGLGQLRTIVSETHTYKCIAGNTNIPDKMKDVVIFTSLYNIGGSKFNFMTTTCVKDIKTATIDYCNYSQNMYPTP
jgi:hypothetical protein